jgi:hypothetical protein
MFLVGLAVVCHPTYMFHMEVASAERYLSIFRAPCAHDVFVGPGFKPLTLQDALFIGPGVDSWAWLPVSGQ